MAVQPFNPPPDRGAGRRRDSPVFDANALGDGLGGMMQIEVRAASASAHSSCCCDRRQRQLLNPLLRLWARRGRAL